MEIPNKVLDSDSTPIHFKKFHIQINKSTKTRKIKPFNMPINQTHKYTINSRFSSKLKPQQSYPKSTSKNPTTHHTDATIPKRKPYQFKEKIKGKSRQISDTIRFKPEIQGKNKQKSKKRGSHP
jgi:hypothetical protein